MIKKNFLVNLTKRSITYIYLSNKKVDQHQCVIKVLATYRSTKGRIAIAHNYAWNIIQWYLDITNGQGTKKVCSLSLSFIVSSSFPIYFTVTRTKDMFLH